MIHFKITMIRSDNCLFVLTNSTSVEKSGNKIEVGKRIADEVRRGLSEGHKNVVLLVQHLTVNELKDLIREENLTDHCLIFGNRKPPEQFGYSLSTIYDSLNVAVACGNDVETKIWLNNLKDAFYPPVAVKMTPEAVIKRYGPRYSKPVKMNIPYMGTKIRLTEPWKFLLEKKWENMDIFVMYGGNAKEINPHVITGTVELEFEAGTVLLIGRVGNGFEEEEGRIKVWVEKPCKSMRVADGLNGQKHFWNLPTTPLIFSVKIKEFNKIVGQYSTSVEEHA